jgi:hypothetical protein
VFIHATLYKIVLYLFVQYLSVPVVKKKMQGESKSKHVRWYLKHSLELAAHIIELISHDSQCHNAPEIMQICHFD